MIPLAEAARFKPKVYKWRNEDRLKLMAELDAAYFLFYNIERVDMIYILSTFSGITNQKESIFTDETSRLIIEYYDSFKKSI